MSFVYCGQGHQNLPGSRFCHLCGEKLSTAQQGIYPGLMLGDRYRIRRELAHGGFGRTYVAEDLNRFNETCVLKEFAPQVQGSEALKKAEELFEREAGVLYKLQHPQIPQFRELFRVQLEQQGHLFLVQDYVEGATYRDLLESRRSQGQFFSEAEVIELMTKLLPVLQYIHNMGVIHRDISPDNLILRQSDQMPVLIDFGGVKRIAATVASQFAMSGQSFSASVTRLGKVGYAPEEQLQLGRAFPTSDLYSLAVSVLVLLTGKEPQDLLGEAPSDPSWQQQVRLSSKFSNLLRRMLARQPVSRYQSAAAVMQDLSALSSSATAAVSPARAHSWPAASRGAIAHAPPPLSPPVVAPSPGRMAAATAATLAVASPAPPVRSTGNPILGKALFLGFLAAMVTFGWWMSDRWIPWIDEWLNGPAIDLRDINLPASPDVPSPSLPAAEAEQKQALTRRREALGVNFEFYVELTNASFYDKHPEQQGRMLTTNPEDAPLREDWDAISAEWLDWLEEHLSPEARRGLGTYSATDRDAWRQDANQLYVSSRALYDLADAEFFRLFPEQRDRDFINEPIGQIWHAIALQQLESLKSGETLERIRFESKQRDQEVKGQLEAGAGTVYIANLSADQEMRLTLEAPEDSIFMSLYLPSPTDEEPYLLASSLDSEWSGELPQSGFYEIVLVANSDQPVEYELDIDIENVQSDSVESEQPDEPEAKQ